MKIKVYNQNGVVKITKIITSDEVERTMFRDLKDGEVAEIEVDFCTTTKARKTEASKDVTEQVHTEVNGKESYIKREEEKQFMRAIRLISQDGAVDILYENYSVIILDHQLLGGEEYAVILAYNDTNPNIVYTMGSYCSHKDAVMILGNLREMVSDSEEKNGISYFQFPKDPQSNILPDAIMPSYIKRTIWEQSIMKKEDIIKCYRKRLRFPNLIKAEDKNVYSDLQGDAKKRAPIRSLKMWKVKFLDDKCDK